MPAEQSAELRRHRPRRKPTYAVEVPPISDRIPAQGVRYLVVGTGTTVVQLGLFWLLEGWTGVQPANVLSWIVCTALSTLAHRWFTFHRPASRADQWIGFATSLAALGLTAAALAMFGPDGGLRGGLIVWGVTFAVGCCRFAALRLWFLRPRPVPEPAADAEVAPV